MDALRNSHSIRITSLAALVLFGAVMSFPHPLVTRPASPVYTNKLINEEYRKQYMSLLKQSEPVKVLLDMLIQVVIQQRNEMDIMRGIQLKMTKDLEELRMDSTHLKKYISEHLKLLHSDENPMRTTLGKTSDLYLPYDNYYRGETKLVVNDVIAMNDSLVGLGLRVDTMDQHLEEVEAVVMDVKRATVDDFTDIINAIIPALEQRIEEKYTAVNNINQSLYEKVLKASEILTRSAGNRPDMDTRMQEPTCGADCTNDETNITIQSQDSSGSTTSAINYSQHSISALYEEPIRYIGRVRERFVVREISGYRQKIIGSWMQDGYLKSSKVWMLQGFRKLTNLVEFSNVLTFVEGDVFTAYKMDYECGGTGHAVYNGSFYCHGFKSNKIYKFDLLTHQWNSTRLSGQEIHSSHAYSSGVFNDVDILSDSSGIWVIYTNKESQGYMILNKINPVTLHKEFNATIRAKQEDFMNCFMFEGSLYGIDNWIGGKSVQEVVINRIWTAHDKSEAQSTGKRRRSSAAIVMETESNEIVLSADFNPRHMRLYSWNLIDVDKAQLKWYEFDDNLIST